MGTSQVLIPIHDLTSTMREWKKNKNEKTKTEGIILRGRGITLTL